MNFESGVKFGAGVGGFNIVEVFEQYPIIEEKAVRIMALYVTETKINNKIANLLKSRFYFPAEMELEKVTVAKV